MEKFVVVILDPAHGIDVKGKSSPDGKHREYLWSRKVCSMLEPELIKLGYKVYYTSTEDTEIGLSKRKEIANNIECSSKEVKFLLSLHNNAAGSDGKWHSATGVEIWTSPGKTISDYFSDELFKGLLKYFPEDKIKYRYNKPKDTERDKENNFTVLMGNYAACLLEWLFQDNQDDVDKLSDDSVNSKLVKALVYGIESINDYVKSKIAR